MSKHTNVFVIREQPPAKCSVCGQVAELRPYGKGGAPICFECGMKDRQETERQFARVISGADLVVVDGRKP